MLNEIQQQSYKQPKIHDPLKEKLLMQKGLDAFESMYVGQQALKGATISFDAFKMYLSNFYADPEIRARAEYLWKEYGTPQNARKSLDMSNNIEALAQAGLLGATSAAIIKKIKDSKGYIDRRTFLAAAAMYTAACGGSGNGGGGNPNPGPGPGPSPTYVSFPAPVPLEGLQRQTKLNGEISIPGKPLVIPIVNGQYMVEAKHELVAGEIYRDVQINTDKGVARVTPVMATNSTLLIPLGYKDVPLDAVDDQRIFNLWASTRHEGGTERWDKYLSNFRIFLYDRSKFQDRREGIFKVQDGGLNPPSKAVATIEYVVNNYIAPFTANLHANGGLIRESQSSERPNPGEAGWLFYMFGDDVGSGTGGRVSILQAQNAVLHHGEITSAILLMDLADFADSRVLPNPNDPIPFLGSIGIDTAEGVIATKDGSFSMLLPGGVRRPLEEILAVSTLQYMRRIHNTSNSVPDYQTM